jgi:hypothetical protein
MIVKLATHSYRSSHLFAGGGVLVTEASGIRFLAAMAAAGLLVCSHLDNLGPRNANAGELQFDGKTGSFAQKNSFKGQTGDPNGWFNLKVDGTVWDMNAPGVASSYDPLMFKPVPLMLEPAGLGWNQLPAGKSTLADTRVTLGMWDDRVRLTSRQAVSSYIAPGTNIAYLTQTGPGFDNAASSQRLDTVIWKNGSTSMSLFGEYDRVGTYFQAPNFAIKPQDPFSKPNSTTTRLGGALQQGPITLTLEQRAQQSLVDNAPLKVENLVGISLGFDELWGQSRWIPESISWAVPTSAYLTVGQGRVRAAIDQGVNGDTVSDVSGGLLWNRNKVFAYLGYWRSDYQSRLYPWKGSGFDGSLGYHEGQWGVDLYVDLYRSMTVTSAAYTTVQPAAVTQQSTTEGFNALYTGLAFFFAF